MIKQIKVPISKYKPNPIFKDFIQCYWTLNCYDDDHLNKVYHMDLDAGLELIFNLSDPIECIASDSKPIIIEGDFLIGSFAKQIQIKPTGFFSLFGIRFTHEGLYPFLSMPPVDLSELCVEIDEVWELSGLGVSKLIHNTNPFPERLIQTFERFFSKRISDFRAHSMNVEKAVTIIRSYKGQIPVKTLANRLQISNRHLERKFTERIGVSPKQLCRLFRIKNVLTHFKATECDLASFAVASGYFDQAHFTHEFRHFTGQSPMEYLTQERSATTLIS